MTQVMSTPDGPVTVLSPAERDAIRRRLDGKGLTPRPYQRRLLADGARFRRLRWSRQTGKSYSMALDDVLQNYHTGFNTVQLSASLDLTKELMLKTALHAEAIAGIEGEIQRAVLSGSLDETLYVDEDKIRITQTTVELTNGTRVIGRPANPRTARGFSANLTLDEFAMHKDSDEIWGAAYPSISSNNALRLKVASTPLGKKGKFYSICMEKSLAEGGVWSDHTLTIHDAIRQGLAVNADELKAGLGDDQRWDQEYLVLFVDEASAFLTYDMIRACEHEGLKVLTRIALRDDQQHDDDAIAAMLDWRKLVDLAAYQNGELYLGVDIGRRRDLTCPWLLEKVGDVLWPRAVIELYNVPFRHQQALLAALIGELGVGRTCIDETGVGMMLAENLQHEFGENRVEPIYFTEQSKGRLAEGLRPRVQDVKVRVPVDVRVREDLHGIAKLEGAGGHARYMGEKSGSSGAIHPDHFWGLALGVNAAEAAPAVQLTDKNALVIRRDGRGRDGRPSTIQRVRRVFVG